jgi:GTP cyclohydrolase I
MTTTTPTPLDGSGSGSGSGVVNYPRLHWLGRELLLALGEDPERPGLQDTPRRFASAWREFMEYNAGTVDTCFESVATDQMVVVSGMRVWSMCEHHLLPFWCDIAIGYIAQDRVLGLSKFGRIAQKCAHRLQLQEQLCQQIADEIRAITGTENVAVLAQGEHSCMTSRGVRMPSLMTSSVMYGLFRSDATARTEFLQLVRGTRHA